MNNLQTQIERYLEYCKYQKRLDGKTLKAYRIDLTQFLASIPVSGIEAVTPALLENYIAGLHQKYKPKTVKRKIASIKALFHYFEYRELLDRNPFSRMHIRFREPVILPRTIPLHTVETFLSTIYRQHETAETDYQRNSTLRDIAVIELLFATGMRISELCALKISDVNLCDNYILIYGKGSKERKIQIGNDDVIRMLITYKNTFGQKMLDCNHFFVNQSGRALSDQSVRRMINKYASLAAIDQHITPHMFRHTFATSLLEADVDIRYIQEMLGHSSINITEVYTHVTMAKQRDILSSKHPRKDFHIQRQTLACSEECGDGGSGPA
ncbi:MAG: tyrosine-type recombinase/integrase [bacterium]|nr:tyrosine-type recombinase/integrase [bacterium]MCM1376220.1 tyrosine-type recombinase/integrase [Muribaculum sp.]